jgi:hypothetical protein
MRKSDETRLENLLRKQKEQDLSDLETRELVRLSALRARMESSRDSRNEES